jgi:hypothetical protein
MWRWAVRSKPATGVRIAAALWAAIAASGVWAGDFRAIDGDTLVFATRYDKLAASYLAFLKLASIPHLGPR